MLLVNLASGEIDQELPRKANFFTWRTSRLERVRERAVQCALYSVYWVAGEASFGENSWRLVDKQSSCLIRGSAGGIAGLVETPALGVGSYSLCRNQTAGDSDFLPWGRDS